MGDVWTTIGDVAGGVGNFFFGDSKPNSGVTFGGVMTQLGELIMFVTSPPVVVLAGGLATAVTIKKLLLE